MEEKYVLITTTPTPVITIVHTIHISIPVHLYIDLRIQNINNPDMKQSLLLQDLPLQQNKVAEN
jgi:hypothetical protein